MKRIHHNNTLILYFLIVVLLIFSNFRNYAKYQVQKQNETIGYEYTEEMSKAASVMLDKLIIDEGKDNTGYHREDWAPSSVYKYYDPIRESYVGPRDYYLYKVTKVDITDQKAFRYVCPYNGKTYTDYKELDWEHVVPVAYVYRHTNGWTTKQKEEFYISVDNGFAANSHDNRAHSDKGPSEWLPEMNQKWYCYKWLEVCTRNNISVTQADYNTIKNILLE